MVVKGEHHSEFAKLKMRLSSQGRHFSPETEFKSGKDNPNFGKLRSEEVKQKIREKNFGSRHPGWKGDNVAMSTLHQWIAKIKPKPLLCEDCKEVPPVDVANISEKYKRDINDFKWVCRRCHMKSDGRIEEGTKRLNQYVKNKEKIIIKRNKEISRKCPLCGSFYVVKRGFIDGKRQRFGCKNCKIRFS